MALEIQWQILFARVTGASVACGGSASVGPERISLLNSNEHATCEKMNITKLIGEYLVVE